jgi:multiple sugar transport system substrate-binding protein
MNYGYGDGEWFTYGFSPFIESFGGDLINRSITSQQMEY